MKKLRSLKAENSYYSSYSRLLPKNLKIKIYKIIILRVVLIDYETCSLTWEEEHRLKVFQNKILSQLNGSKRD